MKTIQIANLFLEGFCLLICLVLWLYIIYAKDSKNDKSRKYFTTILGAIAFLVLGDSAEWLFGGVAGAKQHAFLVAGLTCYYLAAGAITVFVVRYIEGVVERYETVSDNYKLIARMLFLVQIFICVAELFDHSIYYVDASNNYVYANVYISISCTVAGYILAFIMLLKYTKKLPLRSKVNLYILVLMPAFGSFMQMMFSSIAFVTPCYTLGLLTAFLFIQEEDNIEKEKIAKESAVDLTRSLEESRDAQDMLITQIITALAYSVEAKDQYTNGHSERVANYTREIVHRMGYSEEDQMKAYYIGLLHDIGKIRIPDEIINKTSRLTDEEYEIIKLHTVSGYHILKAISVLPELPIGARWHHERYDGKGYPNGLKGENIPEIARIIALADAYDAMTSNRSYRKTMPQEKVRAEIEKGAGTQFDPEIAKILLQMIDDDYDYDMKQAKAIRKASILVVDDDLFMHKFITLALANEPYIVSCASSAKEAQKILLEEEFDLCLLDLQMPDVDGFEMYDWILENKHKLKVVLLSGDKEFEKIKHAGELGISDYITKPVLVPVLKETIKNVLIHS